MFQQISLAIFFLFFLYTGLHGLAKPRTLARLLSLTPDGESGVVEIRAQYGGFFFAVALSQVAPLALGKGYQQALIISLVVFGGLIFGRVASVLIGARWSEISGAIRMLFTVDALGFLLAALALSLTAT